MDSGKNNFCHNAHPGKNNFSSNVRLGALPVLNLPASGTNFPRHVSSTFLKSLKWKYARKKSRGALAEVENFCSRAPPGRARLR